MCPERTSELVRSDRSFHCSTARDNSCAFTAPRLRVRLSNVRFRPSVCGSNLIASFRQASKPNPRVAFRTMSNASPSRSSLWIDVHGVETCVDVVNCRYGRFQLRCPIKSVSGRCDHCCGRVLKLDCPVLPRFCFGVKARELRKCARLDEGSAT